MKLSVVTPSFRSSNWLKLCIASVADQEGVDLEHIVQDACSDDGTLDWLPKERRVRAYIEKDQGMYDAVNRGFRRATGEVYSYLNADEQYLPGALRAVAEVFERRAEIDILAAHTVVVDPEGNYICSRKAMPAWPLLAWTFIPMTTAALFVRSRVFHEYQLFFDTRWKGIGDVMWMRKALQMRLKAVVLDRFTSTFTETGGNLSLQPSFERERGEARRMRPFWARLLKWPLHQLHRTRALTHGLYSQQSFSYSIYTKNSLGKRQEFFVPKATGIWRQRHG